MDFEWNDAKREANLAKHGIDFMDAVAIWQESIIDPADTRVVAGEERRVALGMIGKDELIIAVIYTWRGKARRLISARRGRRHERAHYQDRFGRGQ